MMQTQADTTTSQRRRNHPHGDYHLHFLSYMGAFAARSAAHLLDLCAFSERYITRGRLGARSGGLLIASQAIP
jgi:hypothetical protein